MGPLQLASLLDCASMIFPVVLAAVAALTLWGCGTAVVTPPTEPFLWQNLRMPNHTALAEVMPKCAFYEYSDLGKKVDDDCCDITKWPEEAKAALDAPSTMVFNGKMHNCFIEVMSAAELFVRNYLGCEDGKLIGASACVPDGVALATDPHGYPMNLTFANTVWANGTFDSCQCSNRSSFPYPSKYGQGPGCYVSLTSYMLGLPTSTPSCTFTKISGTCAASTAASTREYVV